MSLDRTRTRTIRPILPPEFSGGLVKAARPLQRLGANLFDMTLLGFAVFNTYKYFDVEGILPRELLRHHYFVTVFYYYLILTIIPHRLFGQSLGQAITGIKVMTMELKSPSFFKSVVRDLLRPTTLFIPTPVFQKRTRAWYDSFLKTTLVDCR